MADENLSAWLVAKGLAVAYRRYSEDYVEEELNAREAGIGVWAGEFDMPWDWRRGQRSHEEDVNAENPNGCVIKGNVSSKGERIYHTPASPWYSRTKITASRGER